MHHSDPDNLSLQHWDDAASISRSISNTSFTAPSVDYTDDVLFNSCKSASPALVPELDARPILLCTPLPLARLAGYPLHTAVAAADEALTFSLLSSGLDPAHSMPDGTTALHLAAAHGLTQLARLLVAHGAPLEAAALSHFTPLFWAVQRGHEDVTALLLLHGASPDAPPPPASASADSRHTSLYNAPLHAAAARGSVPLLQQLLNAGAVVAAPGRWGYRPLHYAAKVGTSASASLLLARGAPVDSRDANMQTPLHMAARRGSEPVVRVLLAAGADRYAKCWDAGAWGKQIPSELAKEEKHWEVVRCINEFGRPRGDDAGRRKGSVAVLRRAMTPRW